MRNKSSLEAFVTPPPLLYDKELVTVATHLHDTSLTLLTLTVFFNLPKYSLRRMVRRTCSMFASSGLLLLSNYNQINKSSEAEISKDNYAKKKKDLESELNKDVYLVRI